MRPLALLGLTWLCACSAVPLSPVEAESMIAAAEAQEAQGKDLERIARDSLPKPLRERFDFARAKALFAADSGYRAFQALEDLYRDAPRSELLPQAIALQLRIGEYLLGTGRGFLFFYSDHRAGMTVLEHLVSHHAESPELADALRLLGDQAFLAHDFELAQERYRDLLRSRPDSEWNGYARFRFAMSIVAGLKGPDYDLANMGHAERELREFVNTAPEQPEMLSQAKQALQQVVEWQATRERQLAHFYHRVGNQHGYLLHLERAGAERFAATEAGQAARNEREALLRNSLPPDPNNSSSAAR